MPRLRDAQSWGCFETADAYFYLQVEKSLESMEEEAEKLYRDERPSLLDDEAAATRDVMYAFL